MRPVEFLAFARSCLMETATEAAQRSAASRAYYAAWHAARVRLRESGITPPVINEVGRRLGAHERVIEAVGMLPYRDARRMRARLTVLKGLRTRADYELDDSSIAGQVEVAMRLAHDFIVWLDAQDQ